MPEKMDYKILEDPKHLSGFQFCDASVYKDLLAVRAGHLSEGTFDKKYQREKALLRLTMKGLTATGLRCGSLACLFSILDMQQIVAPVLSEYNARHARAFADDFVATFDKADEALNAAFEIHRRIHSFNLVHQSRDKQLRCSIGVGFGRTYEIGIDKSMGDEMNQVSKLGEEIARPSETLITGRAYSILKSRKDCNFIKRMEEGIQFVFFEAVKKARVK